MMLQLIKHCCVLVLGAQVKQSEVSVKVSVYNSQSYGIIFKGTPYSKTLPESTAQGTNIIKIQATCPKTITYSIVGDNTDSVFQVDSNSGQITLAKSLDYESKPSYSLAVRALCNSSPQLAQDVKVAITVTDVNDNSPKFISSENPEVVVIKSFTPKDTKIFKVRSTRSAVMQF